MTDAVATPGVVAAWADVYLPLIEEVETIPDPDPPGEGDPVAPAPAGPSAVGSKDGALHALEDDEETVTQAFMSPGPGPSAVGYKGAVG